MSLPPLRPGPIHFLRRMKEDLVDYDGKTRLFKGRTARSFRVPLSELEFGYYQAALDMVDPYFPPSRATTGPYGLRQARRVHARGAREDAQRRHEHMGELSEAEAVAGRGPRFQGRRGEADEARVINAGLDSVACRARRDQGAHRRRSGELSPDWRPSKWKRLTTDCLAEQRDPAWDYRSRPSCFREYTDSAGWIAERLGPMDTRRACTRAGRARLNETRPAGVHAR